MFSHKLISIIANFKVTSKMGSVFVSLFISIFKYTDILLSKISYFSIISVYTTSKLLSTIFIQLIDHWWPSGLSVHLECGRLWFGPLAESYQRLIKMVLTAASLDTQH